MDVDILALTPVTCTWDPFSILLDRTLRGPPHLPSVNRSWTIAPSLGSILACLLGTSDSAGTRLCLPPIFPLTHRDRFRVQLDTLSSLTRAALPVLLLSSIVSIPSGLLL